jgi:hypothetical protein
VSSVATAHVGTVRRAIESHLGSQDVTCVIYGAIVGLALVVALEQNPPGPGHVVAALAGTALAVALAELYSEAVGEEARTRRQVGSGRLRVFAGEAVAVAFGAAFPAVFFVVAAAGWIELGTAFTLSKWSGLGLICAYGLVAARLAGAGWARAGVHALAVGAIAGFLIAFKALVH